MVASFDCQPWRYRTTRSHVTTAVQTARREDDGNPNEADLPDNIPDPANPGPPAGFMPNPARVRQLEDREKSTLRNLKLFACILNLHKPRLFSILNV